MTEEEIEDTAKLVEGARCDPERFGRLYERIAPTLFAWCKFRIHPRLHGAMDPQDLQQEVWLRAMKNLDSYDPSQASFRAWLFGIARYTLLECLRRKRELNQQAGTRRADESSADALIDQYPADVTTITQRLARDDTLITFLDRARTFPPEDRLILVRCGFEGWTCGEVAERLGMSEAAVAKRWQRLRKELRARGWAEQLLDPAD